MRLDGTWAIESGGECFILVQTKEGVNRQTQLPCNTHTKTYHPSLVNCAKAIACTQALDAVSRDSLDGVIDLLVFHTNQLIEAINKLPISKVSK